MPLPALQKFERGIGRQLRLLEVRKIVIERKIERQIRVFEEKRGGIGKKIEEQIRQFERKRGIRIDDEVRFIRSWIERPLSIGAVTPSGKILARTMARYVDPDSNGPVVELGPGHRSGDRGAGRGGRRAFAPCSRRIRRERSAASCARAIPTRRWCRATPIVCAGCWKRCCCNPPPHSSPACRWSPSRSRCACGSFATPSISCCPARRSCSSPIRLPRRCRGGLGGFSVEASERIWMNIPPARVWVYRKQLTADDRPRHPTFHASENPDHRRLATRRLAQCPACRARRQRAHARRGRRDAHFARRLRVADLRCRSDG